jgi:Leucine-rich repeat (LRR) protein
MHGLQTLIITNCVYLLKIDMFAFRGLKSLKKLIIENNRELAKIEPHAFGGLKNLDYLSLNLNNLSEISGHIFSSSYMIHTIEFLGNPIKVSCLV